MCGTVSTSAGRYGDGVEGGATTAAAERGKSNQTMAIVPHSVMQEPRNRSYCTSPLRMFSVALPPLLPPCPQPSASLRRQTQRSSTARIVRRRPYRDTA